jgi:hypothetical protein
MSNVKWATSDGIKADWYRMVDLLRLRQQPTTFGKGPSMPALSLIRGRIGEMGVTTATSLWLFFGELIFIKFENFDFLLRKCKKTLALVVQF